MPVKLTEDQWKILRRLADEPGDGHLTAQWIAEMCGHAYDTPWASGRLKTLIRHNLASKVSPGWYAITPAGRSLLQGGDDGR